MARQINLYDPALERRRDWLALQYVAGSAVALAVVVGAFGFLARLDLPELAAQTASEEAAVKATRDQIAALAQLSSRKPDPRLEQEIAAKQQLLAVRAEVLTTLQQNLGPQAHSFADYLRGFSRQTVAGLWLTGFAIEAGGSRMEIQGRTLDPALLPEYIRRLDHEKAFQGQTFAALKLDAAKPEPTTAAGTPAPAPAPTVGPRRPPWHEFILIPAASNEKPGAAAGGASSGRVG